MTRFRFLDSGPLGLLTHPQRSSEVVAITEWLARCLVSGSRVIVPAIVYYELKRELLRAKKSLSIARLDAFVAASPGRYLPLSDEALRLGADLWAKSRQAGQPTADARALDVDVILAAQALSFGAPVGDIMIVTTNPKHLNLFLAAKEWNDLFPYRD